MIEARSKILPSNSHKFIISIRSKKDQSDKWKKFIILPNYKNG